MTAFTCAKCNRRFTPTIEEMRATLAAGEGQKHVHILCPHCGKANKVAPERLREAVRFSPPPVEPAPPAVEG